MTTKYQPFKLVHNRLETICTMVYDTKDKALEYAKTRGLKVSEVVLKDIIYQEEWVLEFRKSK